MCFWFIFFAHFFMLNFEANLVSVWQVCDKNRNLLANILERPSIFPDTHCFGLFSDARVKITMMIDARSKIYEVLSFYALPSQVH